MLIKFLKIIDTEVIPNRFRFLTSGFLCWGIAMSGTVLRDKAGLYVICIAGGAGCVLLGFGLLGIHLSSMLPSEE